jgi:hypothetical protein
MPGAEAMLLLVRARHGLTSKRKLNVLGSGHNVGVEPDVYPGLGACPSKGRKAVRNLLRKLENLVEYD